jgi:hypothetical protein
MWKVVMRPEGRNPAPNPDAEEGSQGRNEGGMVIYLENQGVREEVTRVAFERANSTHPETEFKDQLRAEVSKAHDAVAALREMLSDAGTLA